MAKNRVPGLAVAIIRDDEVLHLKGYGTAGDGRPMTPQTQFYTASLSKSFTALAVMQLVEEGKIELDEPVQTYLPDFTTQDPEAAARVTVRHLLNQTSGLSDAGFPAYTLPQPASIEERVESLRDARPVSEPGKEFHYFNPNYEVLARVVETVSGEPFTDYLQTQVFSPLQMSDTTSVVTTSETSRAATRLAQGHILAFGVPIPREELEGYLGGSGGVISTAEDMANYDGIKQGLIDLLLGKRPQSGGPGAATIGIILAALVLTTTALQVRGLLRLRKWSQKARGRRLWLLAPGLAWKFVPVALLVGLQPLVKFFAGRVFSYWQLFLAMPDVVLWLVVSAVLGTSIGIAHVVVVVRRNLKPQT